MEEAQADQRQVRLKGMDEAVTSETFSSHLSNDVSAFLDNQAGRSFAGKTSYRPFKNARPIYLRAFIKYAGVSKNLYRNRLTLQTAQDLYHDFPLKWDQFLHIFEKLYKGGKEQKRGAHWFGVQFTKQMTEGKLIKKGSKKIRNPQISTFD